MTCNHHFPRRIAIRELPRTLLRELAEDIPISPRNRPTFGEVLGARHGRRAFLRGALGVTAIAALGGPAAAGRAGTGVPPGGDSGGRSGVTGWSFDFPELTAGVDEDHHVAEGFIAEVLIRWGDPVLPGAGTLDPAEQSAAAQEGQFGYNNDFVAFLPLPAGAGRSARGLLAVNHEFTDGGLMFPDSRGRDGETVAIEMAAHGHTVVEVARGAEGRWSYRPDGRYNRRISARSTEIVLSGPAAGHERLRTEADPDGVRVLGTLNNCAGGVTPYGSVLIAEENFQYYFAGTVEDPAERANHARYGVPAGFYDWARYHRRFDVGAEPREPNRFGWVVEIDPYDPDSEPIKRTALGRFKHEGAETVANRDGRLVTFMGDDQRFEYVYKFVSKGRLDPDRRARNFGLLDAGTLYAARFNPDGSLDWLPLVHGTGPLTADNGFRSQAEVLIEARRAADLVGATPMDRPEDVTVDADSGRIYVMLTANAKRKADATHPANPRAGNSTGHILEIRVRDGDFANRRDDWEVLALCGDPAAPAADARWGPGTSGDGWFRNPDNGAVDHGGRLWVATDGNSEAASGRADGIWALETEGPLRGSGRHFYRVPAGAEMCGPCFTPDDETFFVAVQHPGAAPGASFESPATRWPDFEDTMPPRPAVVAITRQGGGRIG
ncbi:PhoX family protein [Thiohalorhabdus sp. Cl-TMA]|uniref:PhoX family phosphatase n=1 Tax=Thiohalorhabdus methylotrophus TaxID=3242694 RepID=A0ABV4TPH5_9GAMM